MTVKITGQKTLSYSRVNIIKARP